MLRPDNGAVATKAKVNGKEGRKDALSFQRSQPPTPFPSPTAFSNCSLFSKVLWRRGGGSQGRNDFLKYIQPGRALLESIDGDWQARVRFLMRSGGPTYWDRGFGK